MGRGRRLRLRGGVLGAPHRGRGPADGGRDTAEGRRGAGLSHRALPGRELEPARRSSRAGWQGGAGSRCASRVEPVGRREGANVTTEAWILGALRTPVGRYGGALSQVRPDDLAAHALRGVVERTGIAPSDLEDVVLGCANQAGEDNRNVARMAALLADLPIEAAGVTVNRLCGSGLEAVANAARSVMVGEADAYLAGGVESMSRAPWAVGKPERAPARGERTMHDTALGWRFVNPEMERRGHTDSLGQTAENLAAGYGIGRERQDRFALRSHEKAIAAADEERFKTELLAVETPSGAVAADEGPRRNTSLEALGRLRPVFRADGTVTAGNSSPLNDGAAALVVSSADYGRRHGLEPLAVIRAVAVAGVAPRIMGIGPEPATAKALSRAGVDLAEIDLIELNEAFAAQSLAVLHAWGLEDDDPRVNANGGAIALGHPLGCSGARLLTTLLYELRRRDARWGLATMCIGVGQGIAMVVERPR
ncbi:MAG: acetyl-CoA C-acyltransferase [Nitriliruptorales bacterium]|nr:acetyl-CoA C-acyltransferase [Nitriliruptorales bacterium]